MGRLLVVTVMVAGTTCPFVILWNIATEDQTTALYETVMTASTICNALQGLVVAVVVMVHRDEHDLHKRRIFDVNSAAMVIRDV